jgi:ribonuclease R
VKREQVTGITVDSQSTKDIDDAIWVEKDSDGWTVTVSIADVASQVAKDTEIDLRAREMVATKYFATGNSPMLPRKLGEMELSLWPDRPKETLSARLRLGLDISTLKVDVLRSRLKSQARVTYDEIPAILADKEHALHQQVSLCAQLAHGLLERRRTNGALVLYDLNNGWVTTEEGFLRKIESHEATIGYIIVQELMVLANGAVAEWAIERDVNVMFRNHIARSAVPPDRRELMGQIEEALHTPVAGLDQVRQRTHMLLSRAEYGAYVRGHYGLNLPAYLHFTSPIRRYADLVNHRQIRAHLKGEQPPYTQQEVEELARHVNETVERERAAASEAFKAMAEEKAQRNAMSPRRIEGLHPKDFERLVKVEARSGQEVSAALVAAAEVRVRENRFPLVCACSVFTDAPVTPGWNAVRSMLLQSMAARPEDAVSLLTMATQTAGWPAVTYEVSSSGPPHNPTFSVSATLPERPNAARIVASLQGGNQARAKQRACVALLALAFGVPIPAFPQEKSPPPPTAPAAKAFKPDMSRDPVSVLMEWGQSAGHTPSFSFEQEGPSHVPTITCTCEVPGVKKTVQAGNKKDAKRAAAKAVLEALALRP